MSEWLVAGLKIGMLILLWVFVFLCAGIIRTDLFGQRLATDRGTTPAGLQKRQKSPRNRRNKEPRALSVVDGRQAGLELPLGSELNIGRSPDSSFIIDDDYASTHHASIRPDGNGGYYIQDHGSTNGTYVNDQRINAPTAIGLRDTVRIGRTSMKLVS